MPAPLNPFKAALAQKKPQIGCWMTFGDALAAELMTTTGFDWLVVDGEHGPNDIRSITDQLRVLSPTSSHAVVRVPIGEDWMLKQALDAGAQTVLVPMVDTAEQAAGVVRACRYAPEGVRGMGGYGARVTNFGAIEDYATTANAQICVLVQAETRAAIANLDDILAVEGVDGVFIGPADLSADMGYPGDLTAPEVQTVIADAITRITAAGKAAGILTLSLEGAKTYLDLGATFVAVGIDTVLLANTARALSRDAKSLISDD
ncbi:HpcH/HpaI aldolase family protein [Shimia marina]|uniref:Hydroxypyruvate/pyruvate aldolase n=1 Tax=Shimia marina TaxID=321267 RepID=A0A0P1FA18_9RHOB|nr:HpcH/HpaI aldolase/citrate lyase family protein [Shimia marina]CUH50833.1 4-hydroxy-2-oxovalerate aldolase [Shimia marina]SFE54249.1 2,4-dihydroxyhept-2-enedioate aldolase [Shimia marina]